MPLLSLPNEVLLIIARCFVDDAEPHLGSESFEFLGRRELLSLVKTNRRLSAIATPLLYHIISVDSLDALLELLVAFFLNPRLAARVNVLGLFLERYSIQTTRSPRAKTILAFAGPAPGSSPHEDLARLVDPDIPWPCGEEGVGPACANLLRQTVNVHTLAIHCLPLLLYGDTTGLAKSFRQLYRDPHADFLPRLERLCLMVPLDVGTAPLMPHAYMNPRGIKRLDQYGGDMSFFHERFDPEPWRNVEVVRLSNVSTSGPWWYRMCWEARPRLRHVDICARFSFPGPGHFRARGFNEALHFCAATLERLHLNIGAKFHYMHDVGPGWHLSCLASMERLTHLELSATLLFPSPTAMGQADICAALPPSLEWLHLREDEVSAPWHGALFPEEVPAWAEYARLLQRAVRQLVFESRGRLPRLKEVRLSQRGEAWDSLEPDLGAVATVDYGVRDSRGCETITMATFAVQRTRPPLA